MGKIGYNINLGALNELITATQASAKETKAPFHLVMTLPTDGINTDEDIAAIDEWANAIHPAQIIWRTYSKLEGDWSVFPSNDEIIRRWQAEDRPQYIRDDPTNEPSLAGKDPNVNSRYVKSRADLLHKAAAAGIKVAVGAFRVGTPHHDLIADGTYDDLIRAVLEGGHYFSVHEYCPGIPGAGDVFPYKELLDPDTVMEAMSSEPWPIQADYKLLRRSDHFVLRAREIGLSDPQIIVTESFIDLISDASEVLNQLHDKYGIPAYDKDLRGVLSWRMYYADAFPEKPFSEVITGLSKYVEENIYYPGYIKGVCLYSLNWKLDTPQGYNFLNPFLDDFRKTGLPNLAEEKSILAPPPSEPATDADTISTRSPEFWAKIREAVAALPLEDEAEGDISEDSTADGIPVAQVSSSDVKSDTGNATAVGVRDETEQSVRASSTIEIPAVDMQKMDSRWQAGQFYSEGVRIRVAPFTDAEPISLLSGETTGEQHVGEIQSDGYIWRWIRYVHQDSSIIEGYAASAFYEFKAK